MIIEPAVNRAKLDELLAEQHESGSLDYKRRLDLDQTRDRVELAKDVGAMQSVGGYIVVGADEHGLPVADLSLAQQQLFDDATVRDKLRKYLPRPIDIRCARHDVDGKHLALIYVAKSPDGAAIFAADGQYAHGGRTHTVFREGDIFVRHGSRSERATQEDLRKVLMARRAESTSASPPTLDEMRRSFWAEFQPAENGVDVRASFGGIGVLRILVRAPEAFEYPGGRLLKSDLEQASRDASAAVGALVAQPFVKTFDWLVNWRPRGTDGWQAGAASRTFEQLSRTTFAAATYNYDGRLSFQISTGLHVGQSPKVAYEHVWLAETIACLAIAGRVFKSLGHAGQLRTVLGLQGLDGAVSWAASRGRAFVAGQPTLTDAYFIEAARFDPVQLAHDPASAAVKLLERLLVALEVDADNVLRRIAVKARA